MTKTIKKNINIYPNLTFEDCVNELRCSSLRKWLIIKLMPRQFRFEKVDNIMTMKANEAIANVTIIPAFSSKKVKPISIGFEA